MKRRTKRKASKMGFDVNGYPYPNFRPKAKLDRGPRQAPFGPGVLGGDDKHAEHHGAKRSVVGCGPDNVNIRTRVKKSSCMMATISVRYRKS